MVLLDLGVEASGNRPSSFVEVDLIQSRPQQLAHRPPPPTRPVNQTSSLTSSKLSGASILARAHTTSHADRTVACGGSSIYRFGSLAGSVFSRCPRSITYWHPLDARQRERRCGQRIDHRQSDDGSCCVVTDGHPTAGNARQDVLAHRVVPLVVLVRQPVVGNRFRESFPVHVHFVGLDERQTLATLVARIEPPLKKLSYSSPGAAPR